MYDPYDIALLLLGLLLFLLGFLLVRRRRRFPANSIPERKLFTPEEQALYAAIEETAGDDFRLLGKIRMADLLPPEARPAAARRLLQERSAPFVLCRRSDFSVAAVIVPEEDTGSDEALGMLAAAGVTVLRPPTRPLAPERLKFLLANLSRGTETAPGDEWEMGGLDWLKPDEEDDWLAGIENRGPRGSRSDLSEKPSSRAEGAELLCPECGAGMQKRRMARGPYAGRELWTCPNFPRCRKTLPVLML